MDANPTLRFLVEEVHARSLAFVALTHPHEDHARGLSHLLHYFENAIGEIWIFQGYQDVYLDRYFKALFKSKQKLPCEKLFAEQPGFFYLELMHIRDHVHRQCDHNNPDRSRFRYFQGYESFRLKGESVQLHFLGPSDQLAVEYQASIIDNLSGVVGEDARVLERDWRPSQVNHNRISPCLLVEYGKTRLVFGGDMEDRAWQVLLEEQEDATVERPSLACHFVKVSHHGSANGYCEGLYDAFGADGPPIVALTPFTRHRNPLPHSDGIAHLQSHAREVFATNVRRAAESSGSEPRREPNHLGSEWRVLLRQHPEWIGALDPALVDAENDVRPLASVPSELVSVLRGSPELTKSLRADLHEKLPFKGFDLTAEDDYRLSFFFNAQGQELKKKRYEGAGAGRLV
ncbi:MAG: ComEC/Rec2 family competence protein [Planctomycetota bacterium]